MLWKISNNWSGLNSKEISQSKAKDLLYQSGLEKVFATASVQGTSHRSGTIKLKNDCFLHYMP